MRRKMVMYLIKKKSIINTNYCRNDGNSANCKMHYVDWSGNGGTQHGHYLYDPFEDEAALLFGNHHHICPEMKKALQGVFLIAEQKKRIEESTKVSFSYKDINTSTLLTFGLERGLLRNVFLDRG